MPKVEILKDDFTCFHQIEKVSWVQEDPGYFGVFLVGVWNVFSACQSIQWPGSSYACWGSNMRIKVIDLLPCLFSIVSHLPGGHFPPPKFGHLPPPNSDISHPKKKTFARRTTATPQFFFLFWRNFLGFFDLQLMEDTKDGKEEVLEEVVMEHIK